jgi:hypothetical protein
MKNNRIDFDYLIEKIDEKYNELGHKKGYRFLLSSKNNFSSDILFLNLNPGGDKIMKDHHSESCERGPAHITEIWHNYPIGKAPLQIQVQRMFEELSEILPGNRKLINEALIAYFIPFRSKNFNDLHAKKKSIEFGISFWKEIFQVIQPKLIICIGNDTWNNLKDLFSFSNKPFEINLGWKNSNGGEIKGQVYFFNNGQRILKLPHLSRYKIFGRMESKKQVKKLLKEATKNWI